MPAISPITGSRCGATRQICRSLHDSHLGHLQWPWKDGLALFDERLGGFLVVGGLAGARVMDRLGVETGFQRQVLGVVDVALDVAQRHRRALRQRHRQLMRRRFDLGVGHHLGHHAERERFLRRQHRRHQIELARLGAAEQMGQEIGAAVIARQADLGERGGDLDRRAGDAEIAGQRDRKPGAGGRAIELRHHRLRHLVQDARDFHAAPQIGHLGFERQRRPPLRHRFDVAADAERAAGALEQHGADLVILRRAPRRLDQPPRHVRIERVAPVGPVHGDGEQARNRGFAGPCRVMSFRFRCYWLSLSTVIARRSEAIRARNARRLRWLRSLRCASQ